MKSSSRSISRSNTPALKIEVRRIHRRDLNRAWEFLKLVFREINRRTVEYHRPRSKSRFFEVYDEEGTEQLLFVTQEAGQAKIVGYAECAYDISGSDNWLNERYFRSHEMRPLFVEELAALSRAQQKNLAFILGKQEKTKTRVVSFTAEEPARLSAEFGFDAALLARLSELSPRRAIPRAAIQHSRGARLTLQTRPCHGRAAIPTPRSPGHP